MTGSFTRRRFLTGSAGTAGVAALVSGCTGDGGSGATGAVDDLDTAATAAGVEKLTVDTYTAAGRLATDGKLGAAIPPAVAAFVATATGHHQQALNRWNKLLTDAGRPEVTAPKEALRTIVDAGIARLTDVPGVAALALRLEDYGSQTYQKALPALKTAEAIRLAAEISVVSHQRQAVLRYLLGLYPVGSGTAPGAIDFAPANPTLPLLAG